MADDKDIAEQAQGGGRKKLIIIGVAILVLLLAAGATLSAIDSQGSLGS